MRLQRILSVLLIVVFLCSNLVYADQRYLATNSIYELFDRASRDEQFMGVMTSVGAWIHRYPVDKPRDEGIIKEIQELLARLNSALAGYRPRGKVIFDGERDDSGNIKIPYIVNRGEGLYQAVFTFEAGDREEQVVVSYRFDAGGLQLIELSKDPSLIAEIVELARRGVYNIAKGEHVLPDEIESILKKANKSPLSTYPQYLGYIQEAISYWKNNVKDEVSKREDKPATWVKDGAIGLWLEDKLKKDKIIIVDTDSIALVGILHDSRIKYQFLHIDRNGNVYVPKRLIEVLMAPDELEGILRPYLGDGLYQEIYGSQSDLAMFLKRQFWGAIGHEVTEGILEIKKGAGFDQERAHEFANRVEMIPAGRNNIDNESWFDLTGKFLLLYEMGLEPSINLFNILRDHEILDAEDLGFGYHKKYLDLEATPGLIPVFQKEFGVQEGDRFSFVVHEGKLVALLKETPRALPVVRIVNPAKAGLEGQILEILTHGGKVISNVKRYPTWKEVPKGELYLDEYAKLFPLVLEFLTRYGSGRFKKYADVLSGVTVSVGNTNLYRKKYFHIDRANSRIIINKEFLDFLMQSDYFLMQSGYKKICMAFFASIASRYDRGEDEADGVEISVVNDIAGKGLFDRTRLDDAKRLFDLMKTVQENDSVEGGGRYFLKDDDVELIIADNLHRGRILDSRRLWQVLLRVYGYYGAYYTREDLQRSLDGFASKHHEVVDVEDVWVEGLNAVIEKSRIYSFKRDFQRDSNFTERWCVWDAEVARQDEVSFGGKAAHTGEMMYAPRIVTLRNFFTTPRAFRGLFSHNTRDVFLETIRGNLEMINRFLTTPSHNLDVPADQLTDELEQELRVLRVLIDEGRKDTTIRQQIEEVRIVLNSIINDDEVNKLRVYRDRLEDEGKLNVQSKELSDELYRELESRGMKIDRKSTTTVEKVIDDRIEFLETCRFREEDLGAYFERLGRTTAAKIMDIERRLDSGTISHGKYEFLYSIYLNRYSTLMLLALRNAAVPSDLRNTLKDYIKELANVLDIPLNELCLGVRSSAAGEDSEQASFAGRQDTYLFVRPIPTSNDPEGLDVIIDAWVFNQASLFNMRAIDYRLKMKLPIYDPKVEISSLFQVMFLSELSWIGFSVNKRGEPGIFMSVTEGQGEMLVSGRETGDSYFTSFDGTVRMRQKAERNEMMVGTPDGLRKVRRRIPGYRRREFAQTSNYVISRAARYMRFLHDYYGIFVDLEGAFRVKRDKDGNVIWLRDKDGGIVRDERGKPVPDWTIVSTQARPETKWNLEDPDVIRLRREVVTDEAFEKAQRERRVLDFEFVAKTGGTAKGEIAKILTKNPEDLARASDKIMLAWQSDPDMNRAMIASRGIIAVRGGPNSHTMIVATEFGLIAITGTRDQLIDVLFDGDEITIDAERGKILLGIDHETRIVGNDFNIRDLPGLEGIRLGTIAASRDKFFSQRPLRNWPSYYGVGLMRLELLLDEIAIIPEALLDYDNLLKKERGEEWSGGILDREKDKELIEAIEFILFQNVDVNLIISYANYLAGQHGMGPVARIEGVEELDSVWDNTFIQEMNARRPEGISDEDIINYARFLYKARIEKALDTLLSEQDIEFIRRLNLAYIGPEPGATRYVSILSEGIQNAGDELIPDMERVRELYQQIEERWVRALVAMIVSDYYREGLGRKGYLERLRGLAANKDVSSKDRSVIDRIIDMLDKTLYVRTDDRKSDEYKMVKGADKYIVVERNPMMGWRGLDLMLANERTFRLQLQAIKKVAERKRNMIGVFVPIARRPEDVLRFLVIMNEEGLTVDLVKRGIMTELPINSIRIDEFLNLVNPLVIRRLLEDTYRSIVKNEVILGRFSSVVAEIIVQSIQNSKNPGESYNRVLTDIDTNKDAIQMEGVDFDNLKTFSARIAQAAMEGIDFTSTGGNDGLQTVYRIDRQTGRLELKKTGNDYSPAVLRWNAEVIKGGRRNSESRGQKGLSRQAHGYCGNAPSIRGQEDYGRILAGLGYDSVSVVLEQFEPVARNLVDPSLVLPEEAVKARDYVIEKNQHANPELIEYEQYNISNFHLTRLEGVHYQLLLDYDQGRLVVKEKREKLGRVKNHLNGEIAKKKAAIDKEKQRGIQADKNTIKVLSKEVGDLEKRLKEVEYKIESYELNIRVRSLLRRHGIRPDIPDAGKILYTRFLTEHIRVAAERAKTNGKTLVIGTADEPSDRLRGLVGGKRYTDEEANPDYGYLGLIKQVNADRGIFKWDLEVIKALREGGYDIGLTFRVVRGVPEIDEAIKILKEVGLEDIMLGVDVLTPSNLFEIDEILEPSRGIAFISVPERKTLAAMMIAAESENRNTVLVLDKDLVDATKDAIVILATAVEKHRKKLHIEGLKPSKPTELAPLGGVASGQIQAAVHIIGASGREFPVPDDVDVGDQAEAREQSFFRMGRVASYINGAVKIAGSFFDLFDKLKKTPKPQPAVYAFRFEDIIADIRTEEITDDSLWERVITKRANTAIAKTIWYLKQYNPDAVLVVYSDKVTETRMKAALNAIEAAGVFEHIIPGDEIVVARQMADKGKIVFATSHDVRGYRTVKVSRAADTSHRSMVPFEEVVTVMSEMLDGLGDAGKARILEGYKIWLQQAGFTEDELDAYLAELHSALDESSELVVSLPIPPLPKAGSVIEELDREYLQKEISTYA